MTTKKTIRIRRKPKKPTRKKKVKRSTPLYNTCTTLGSMIAWADEMGVEDYNKVVFTTEEDYSSYYDHHTSYDYFLEYTSPESDAEFALRMEEYKGKKAVWDKWYKENKEAIEAEKARRVAAEEAELEKKAAKALARKKKQLAALKKELGVD